MKKLLLVSSLFILAADYVYAAGNDISCNTVPSCSDYGYVDTVDDTFYDKCYKAVKCPFDPNYALCVIKAERWSLNACAVGEFLINTGLTGAGNPYMCSNTSSDNAYRVVVATDSNYVYYTTQADFTNELNSTTSNSRNCSGVTFPAACKLLDIEYFKKYISVLNSGFTSNKRICASDLANYRYNATSGSIAEFNAATTSGNQEYWYSCAKSMSKTTSSTGTTGTSTNQTSNPFLNSSLVGGNNSVD